jgi:predicted dienelactone hydrolase
MAWGQTRTALCWVVIVALTACGSSEGVADLGTGDAASTLDLSDSRSEQSDSLTLGEIGNRCGEQCPDLVDIIDASLPDTTPDVPPDLHDVYELLPDLETNDAPPDIKQPGQFHHPAMWGPYEVGVRSYQFFDNERQRLVPVHVWYPALPSGQELEKYLMMLEGKAYKDAPPNLATAPYPMVLFSHGFNGIAWQSLTFTNYVASHGYVVIAMDHQGNTLFDFNADDELVAKVALERPWDVKFAYEQVVAMGLDIANPLLGMVEPTQVAVTGHSFGGYTALLAAGGDNNVDNAKAECDAGSPSDIFCPYISYWPAGETVSLNPGIPGLKAVACLAPGGYSAFGDAGLAKIELPALIVGGSLDPTTPVDIEIEPIYEALGTPKYEAIVTQASHMSFTNVCDLPPAKLFLTDFCGVEGMLGPDETFPPVNALVVAFLNYYVRDDAQYGGFLSQQYLDDAFGFVQFESVQ